MRPSTFHTLRANSLHSYYIYSGSPPTQWPCVVYMITCTCTPLLWPTRDYPLYLHRHTPPLQDLTKSEQDKAVRRPNNIYKNDRPAGEYKWYVKNMNILMFLVNFVILNITTGGYRLEEKKYYKKHITLSSRDDPQWVIH